MFVNGQKVRKPFTNFSPVFDHYLRTFTNSFTNIYELCVSFTNFRVRLRTCVFRLRTWEFIYQLACFVYELSVLYGFIYELACFVYELQVSLYVSFTNLHHASHTNFPFANLGVHWRVWGFLDGISRPLTNFAKIDFGAYINEFGVDRWTLGSMDKFCHMQKKYLFFRGGKGNTDKLLDKKKGAIQWNDKKRTFVTWPRRWPNSNEQTGRKEWTVWGEFTRRLKNLRWRNWGLKDEQWFQQFFEKLFCDLLRGANCSWTVFWKVDFCHGLPQVCAWTPGLPHGEEKSAHEAQSSCTVCIFLQRKKRTSVWLSNRNSWGRMSVKMMGPIQGWCVGWES